MINFIYPQGAEQFEAAAFRQDGTIIKYGHREECDTAAYDAAGLYCLWINGKPVIKTDYAHLNDETSAEGPQD